MQSEVFTEKFRKEINYGVFTPKNFIQGLPLIVYLHGAGERGEKYEHVYAWGLPSLIKSGKEINAVILCPQCPRDCIWDNIVFDIKSIIDKVSEKYSVDKTKIAITGSSMAGFGTFAMAMTFSNFFSVAIPVAGGSLSWRAPNLRSTPVICYHGDKDDWVPIIYSSLMVNAINSAGGKAELITMKDFGHNDEINNAYYNTDLIEKLLNAKRTDFSIVPEFCSECFD